MTTRDIKKNKTIEKVSKQVITTKVIEVIKNSIPENKIVEITADSRFFEDIGITESLLESLSLPFSIICREYGGRDITESEAKNFKTVGNAIDLVYKRANK